MIICIILIQNYGVTPRSSMQNHKYYRISELAELTGFTTDTIRFYEKKKLLEPCIRGNNNYRYFDENSLKRLLFIKKCRALDISLPEINNLLILENSPQQSCSSVNALIDNHIKQVTDKIKELQIFQKELIALRSSCNSTATIDNCKILKQLESN
jgi:Cd(II)/Pb(II)-responsive transcriptional regulator